MVRSVVFFKHNSHFLSIRRSGSHSEDGLLSVHSSFQVVLKQMGKRDTTTKLKVSMRSDHVTVM